MSKTPFDIFATNGLDPVVDAFKANFTESDELGAQFCLMRDGDILLDLKGGWADRTKETPVNDRTLFGVYSSGKAMAALVIAHLVEEDRLGYDQIVTTLWSDFGQHGKDKLTVAQLLSHQAGLSGITDPNWTAEAWFDWDKTIAALATQKPLYEPGKVSGYHPLTFGYLAGELVRLADKDGRTLGTILREDLSQPFNADVWIGLPESEHARSAAMVKPKTMADLGEINAASRAAFLMPWSSTGGMSVKAWREAEFAGSNCHATAKGLATLMQVAASGRCGESPVLSEDTLAAFSKPRISGQDLVLPFDITFAAGLMVNLPNFFYGTTPTTLGHSGWGGSCVFADPVTRLHGAYVMNRQHGTLLGDMRPRKIIDAAYQALGI